ncbi:MAG: flagellar hook-associated protein FlgK, partial [Terriglobia bacterium]
MGNLSSSLNIALQSLMADQAAIDVTSNNIANANTPGYSRQRPVFDAEPPVTYGNVDFGMGASLQQVQSVTDPVLELQIDQQTQNQGQLSSYLNAMQQVSSVFNETQGAGLQSALSQFFSSFQELSTNPTDTTLRQSVLNAGQSLATAFNQASTSLGQISGSLDQSVVQTVGQVNQLTSQIAQLDAQIGKLPINTQSTGSLQDQRAQLINQLSGLVGVSITNLDNGIVSITTASG